MYEISVTCLWDQLEVALNTITNLHIWEFLVLDMLDLQSLIIPQLVYIRYDLPSSLPFFLASIAFIVS
uniref:Uncharacterized protein n=1 Tax=Rhizophora mucronata TaxID=61149 RepID=A0A2P2N0T8_RHIMU